MPQPMALIVDVAPLRESRDFRLLLLGNVLSGIGTQAALVALPFQVYVLTGSALLTGLLGAVELVPLASMALLGGALADRTDRRRILLADQVALVATAAALAVCAFAGSPPLLLLYALAGLLAGLGAVNNVTRSAIVPNVVPLRHLKAALALNFGLSQLTLVLGPALGGLMISAWGVGAAYVADGVSCLAMVAALIRMSAQPPIDARTRTSIRRAIGEGLRYVRSQQALMGTLTIDFMAMTFGMPRVLFPVLALTVYDAGAAGTGLLHAAVSAGAMVAAFTTGWLASARRLGRIVIGAVAIWGVAIAGAGVVGGLWAAAGLLAIAGAADSVSAVCRNTINQSITPDHVRGRMSSIFSLVATSGPRVGDVEAGAVAAVAGPRMSVVSGGIACVVGVAIVAVCVPGLARYDADEWLPEAARS
jgi:MFS family permease